jgi:hypothetical protein
MFECKTNEDIEKSNDLFMTTDYLKDKKFWDKATKHISNITMQQNNSYEEIHQVFF